MKNIILDKERLISCREKLNITKQEAAKRMQMSQPAYLRYESGDRNPSIHVIQTMANALGTSVEYLTGETNNPAPTCFAINKSDNPELFGIIEMFSQTDANEKKRFLTYMKKYLEHIKHL
ncbi:MAG: helix-turn-helix domain-containing protein [Lachnospiraceae bacterium]|nr:helix-turn-helix domain-containing protein [Lachnospiraceae bacterium]MDD3617076.1 helix-turn-helix domain-containing protein [Lachnospiraceae bacterium]